MKCAVAVLFCVLRGAVTPANAQQSVAPKPDPSASVVTAVAPPEPEFAGVVFQLSEGKLLPLDSQKLTPARIKFFGKVEIAYTIAGVSSPTKIGPAAEFVVKLDRERNPSQFVNLDRLTVNQKSSVRKVKRDDASKAVDSGSLVMAPRH